MTLRKRLSGFALGECSFTNTSLMTEQQNVNPNVPFHEQVHHGSGDQAADHFFSLDGFNIPKHINELYNHETSTEESLAT